MKKIISILFLGGAKRVSLAQHLIDEGYKRNTDIRIVSYELSQEVPIASVGEVITGKRWKDTELYNHLATIIEGKKIDVVLPFVDQAIDVAIGLKERHPNLFVPCSSREVCATMFDKQLSNNWFVKHYIPVPPFFNSQDNFVYPIILKPRTGSASKGIKVVHQATELNDIGALNSYLIQSYIQENEEYTTDCYVDRDGEILAIVPRIRLETAGGEVMSSKTVRDKEIIDLSRKILNADHFRGPITIQFIRNKNSGSTYAMEINPRLGGGVVTAIGAGANIPSFLLDECEEKKSLPIENWRENTLMTRYFKEVIFYADNH